MSTMEDQEKRIEEQKSGDSAVANAASARPANGDETQVGQVMQNMARVTRQFTAPAPTKRAVAQAASAALRERIASLIVALGDPLNPLHHQAVDDLVAIGAPAVPALNEALGPSHPWLTSYRAAEALGQIGDGRAAGPLLEALRHPNSNVRWSAVRALAVVGDARALLDLRRVARDDQGKTSWGEPVAGAAQSVLDQMQSHNMLLRGADLIKTAVACVLMLVALILAWSVITTLRADLRRVGHEAVPQGIVAPLAPTANATTDAAAAQENATPTAEPTAEPTIATSGVVSGTVIETGNVRQLPTRNGTRIGGVTQGDEIIFLAVTSDRNWYLVRLGQNYASSSRIGSLDGTGWVNRTLLSTPTSDVPVEDPQLTDLETETPDVPTETP